MARWNAGIRHRWARPKFSYLRAYGIIAERNPQLQESVLDAIIPDRTRHAAAKG